MTFLNNLSKLTGTHRFFFCFPITLPLPFPLSRRSLKLVAAARWRSSTQLSTMRGIILSGLHSRMKSPRGVNNVTCPTYALKDDQSPFVGRGTMYDRFYRPIIMPNDTIIHMEQFSCCWLHESTAAVSWFLQRPARVVLHEHQVCHILTDEKFHSHSIEENVCFCCSL